MTADEPVEGRQVTSWDDDNACHGAHMVQPGHWTMDPHHFADCHAYMPPSVPIESRDPAKGDALSNDWEAATAGGDWETIRWRVGRSSRPRRPMGTGSSALDDGSDDSKGSGDALKPPDA